MDEGMRSRILVADADTGGVKVLAAILTDAGYQVLPAHSQGEAQKILCEQGVDAIITDYRLPGGEDLQLLRQAVATGTEVPVFVLTALRPEEELPISIAEDGAWFVFRKPPEYHQLENLLGRAMVERQMRRKLEENERDLRWLKTRQQLCCGDGSRSTATRILEQARLAPGHVLLVSESGNGQNMLAKGLHRCWYQEPAPFMTIDCGSGEMIFPDRVSEKMDPLTLLSVNQGPTGTVYLRQIDRLLLQEQHRLLIWLKQMKYRVVASAEPPIETDLVLERFPSGLHDVFWESRFHVPPLRHRREEIPGLAAMCLNNYSGNPQCSFSAGALVKLIEYDWPGNEEQLRQVIWRTAVPSAPDMIEAKHLPPEILDRSPGLESLREMEAKAIQDTLEKCCGNKSQAARILGLSRKALYHRLKRIDLEAACAS